MSEFRVASRYAKSMLNLAIEQKLEDKIRDDMQLIADTCEENRSLVVILKNPVIKFDKKMNILRKLFEGKVNPLVIRFLELMSRKNRANLLPDIARVWIDFYNEHKNIVKANITSAAPLTSEARKKVLEAVTAKTGKKVMLEEKIDKDIIGGYILNIKDEQIDSSISGKLNALRRQLVNRV